MRLPTFASLLLASFVSFANAVGTIPNFEQIITVNSADQTIYGLEANRNNQIATLYQPENRRLEHLFFYGEDLSTDYVIENRRFVDMSFSNWGASILDFGGPGTSNWAAPVGQAPFEISSVAVSGSLGTINDTGRIAIFSRESGTHGYRDIYIRDPDETRRLLPDLGEHVIEASPLVDNDGRLIAIHHFQTPEFKRDVYRFTDGQGWENLTAERLPDSVIVSSSVNNGGDRAISPAGDFIFSTYRTTENGVLIPEVLLWDDDLQKIETVMDQSSQFVNFFGNPYALSITAQFSDTNALWLTANDFRFGVTEFRSLYRRDGGDVVDIEALLPSGFSLVPDRRSHTMNFDGDLWVAARNEGDETNVFFFIDDGNIATEVHRSPNRILDGVLTNSHEFYAWQQDEQSGDWTLSRLAVPEPSSGAMMIMAMLVFATFRREFAFV